MHIRLSLLTGAFAFVLGCALTVNAQAASVAGAAGEDPAGGAREDVAGGAREDVAALRAALDQLRGEYDARIAALEARLGAAQSEAQQSATVPVEALASGGAPVPAPTSASSMYSRAFNPAIGAVFQGQAWHYDHDPQQYRIPGFPLGGEAGPVPRGLALGETEIDMNANVDDKFTAWLTLPVVVEDGESRVEIEEAWIETLALPAGLATRFGRFFSGIGYLNDRHSHTWDFIDQPLPYQAFLGGQYLDDGVRVSWLAPTATYLEFSGEVFRGARYPAAGAKDAGFGTRAFYVRVGGDAGEGSSWLAGLSYLHAGARDRPSGDPQDPLLFTGDSDVAIADVVWKWAPHGNWRRRNLILQSEYLFSHEDGNYVVPGAGPQRYDNDQSGWYVQTVYQPYPHWRVGARFDALSSDDPGAAFAGTDLDPGGIPKRYSVMADWSNSEFSRLRVQYTRDDANVKHDNQWGLQYLYSIGAHGAHSF